MPGLSDQFDAITIGIAAEGRRAAGAAAAHGHTGRLQPRQHGFQVTHRQRQVAVAAAVRRPVLHRIGIGQFQQVDLGLERTCNDLHLIDVANRLELVDVEAGGIDLLFCALVLEYIDPAPFLARASTWLSAEGALVVILQLLSQKSGKVSETPYKSLKRLDPVMNLLDARRLRHLVNRSGLSETKSRTETLASGKAFFIAHYSFHRIKSYYIYTLSTI